MAERGKALRPLQEDVLKVEKATLTGVKPDTGMVLSAIFVSGQKPIWSNNSYFPNSL